MNRLHLIFLHGFLGNRDFWKPVERKVKIALPQVTTQRLDLPGHGDSSFFEHLQTCAPTFAHATEWLAAHSSTTSPSWLIGYSMGARLALGTLLRHSDRFHGAILFSVHPGITNQEERQQRIAWEQKLIGLLKANNTDTAQTTVTMSPLVNHFETLPIFESQKQLPQKLLRSQRAVRLNHPPHQIAKAISLLGLGTMPPMVEALQKNTKPIGVITGNLDKKYTRIAFEIYRTCPGIHHTSVDNAGHNVVLELPDTSAQLIVRQLADQLANGPCLDGF